MKASSQAWVMHLAIDIMCLIACAILSIPNAWWVAIIINMFFWLQYRKQLMAESGQLHEDESHF